MSEIEELTKIVTDFCKKRNWDQFHKPKDVAMSVSIEAGEILEHFQWRSDEEIKNYIKKHKNEIGSEIADVLFYLLLLSNKTDINMTKAFKQKMKLNNKKYPIKKFLGKHTNKYNA